MKLSLLVLLSLCAFTAAMVPRHREDLQKMSPQAGSDGDKIICAATTPCAWSVYKAVSKIVEFNITNNYCKCGKGYVCENDEDDESVYIFRCKALT